MKLSDNALEVARSRYFHEGEDWETCCRRIGRAIAINETDSSWGEIFSQEIYDMNFIPGGRTLRNAGKLRPSLLNCATLPIGDSIEEIGETIKNALIMWSYGMGIGVDFSPLRGANEPLKSKGGTSSGMLSFISAIDAVAHTIETGGQRRSGMLGMCRADHPQILDFIKAKLVDKKLSYFNLSVAVDSKFLRAVEENDEWDLTFAGIKKDTVKAKEVWDLILESMIHCGDPGLINIENLRKNNSYSFQRISCVNLCSELPLPDYGTCCLGSLVLPSFISGKSTNWKKLKRSIEVAVRFLDNVIDVNFYPIPEAAKVSKDARRQGLGVMGLHDYLMAKEIRYGSEQATSEIERLFRFIRDTAYYASCNLAREKGAFPKYSRLDYSNASFIKKLPVKLRRYIKEHSIRSCTLISAQPTGTTSLLADVSSGIEPIYALACTRKDRVSERIYIHPRLVEFLRSEEKSKPDWLVDTSDLSPEDHLEVQLTIQKYCCNAVSKTINCPSTFSKKDLSNLILEYIPFLKGVTVYVEGSKEGAPLNRLSTDEARKYLKEAKDTDSYLVDNCRGGSCDL